MPAPPWRLVEKETGRTVVESLEVADSYWSRLVGWQFRRRPNAGHGLLLVPCSSVHTMWLRFSLDLVLLDRGGRVLAVRNGLRPWRAILPQSQTHAILELPADEHAIEADQILRVMGENGTSFPKSLRFLRD
jgi:uncharacterized membrane protein (UPF0127 family)